MCFEVCFCLCGDGVVLEFFVFVYFEVLWVVLFWDVLLFGLLFFGCRFELLVLFFVFVLLVWEFIFCFGWLCGWGVCLVLCLLVLSGVEFCLLVLEEGILVVLGGRWVNIWVLYLLFRNICSVRCMFEVNFWEVVVVYFFFGDMWFLV